MTDFASVTLSEVNKPGQVFYKYSSTQREDVPWIILSKDATPFVTFKNNEELVPALNMQDYRIYGFHPHEYVSVEEALV